MTELKGKVLIKFTDNTNDLVDYVVGADGIFSNTRSFFEKKKSQPLFKKAIAVRLVFKKHNLDILCNIRECQKNKNDVQKSIKI